MLSSGIVQCTLQAGFEFVRAANGRFEFVRATTSPGTLPFFRPEFRRISTVAFGRTSPTTIWFLVLIRVLNSPMMSLSTQVPPLVVFETQPLRIGFEENKDLPTILSTLIVGRYSVITECLGSPVFSKAVQAHDYFYHQPSLYKKRKQMGKHAYMKIGNPLCLKPTTRTRRKLVQKAQQSVSDLLFNCRQLRAKTLRSHENEQFRSFASKSFDSTWKA